MEPVLTVENISKVYRLFDRRRDRLKEMLLKRLGRQFGKDFWALKNISFDLQPGEALGIIGRNGSGKSTLLQILAGTLTPTGGRVDVRGRVAALLELGSGFNPEFTGKDNIYLNGAILGLNRREIDSHYDAILAFADIGDFIDQPIKFYSSGMFVRLAFAVQACVEPDILIIDEALGVGDIFFQQKCYARLEKLLEEGKVIVFVSHDMTAVERFCSQVLLLNQGEPVYFGDPNEAVQRYYFLERGFHPPADREKLRPGFAISPATSETGLNTLSFWPSPEHFKLSENAAIIGGQSARFSGAALCNLLGKPQTVFEMGETAQFCYELELQEDIEVPIGGLVITNHHNINVHGKNSAQALLEAPQGVSSGQRIRFCQTVRLSLAPGQYTYSLGFSTLPAKDYAKLPHLPYSHFDRLAKVLLVVQQAGSFQIVLRRDPTTIDFPFHGTADLEESFRMVLC
jgi:lipopolysaccharide transport system ATP-binding protein